MPAKLGSSSPIDREGTGETPVAGSPFRLVDAIPRGPASIDEWTAARFGEYAGGRPRCPVCLKSSRVSWTGHFSNVSGDFHCRKCRVCWFDSDDALCFVCGVVFPAHLEMSPIYPHSHLQKEGHGVCYHLNKITHPYCDRCADIIGDDRNHCRRELRRRVGLRRQRHQSANP